MYSKVLELDPSYSYTLYNLGLVYQENQELDEALKYYKKALEIEPKMVNALHNSGLVLNI